MSHDVFVDTAFLLFQDLHFRLNRGVLCDPIGAKSTQTFGFRKSSVFVLMIDLLWSDFSDF